MKDHVKRILHTFPGHQTVFRMLRNVPGLPEGLWKHLYFEGEFLVPIENHTFLLRHSGHRVENEIFWKGIFGQWEAHSLRIWFYLAKKSDGIIDVGANSGIYSLLAYVANPQGMVVAFEPLPEAFKLLQENISINNFCILPFQAAVSDSIGTSTLFGSSDDFQYSASLVGDFSIGMSAKSTVVTTTIDHLIDEQPNIKIDLIKIDVEGAEISVLKGMRETLEKQQPNLIIEILNDESENYVRKISEEYDYKYVWIDETAGLKKTRPEDVASRNVLLIHAADLENLIHDCPEILFS